MRRFFTVGIVLGLVLAGCKTSPESTDISSVDPDESSPSLFTDPRLEGEPLDEIDRKELCELVSEFTETHDAFAGEATLGYLLEDDRYCQVDGLTWNIEGQGKDARGKKTPISLGFYQYPDTELQQLRDKAAQTELLFDACELVTFYDGHVTLSSVGGPVPYCEEQTTVANTAYLVRHATVITVRIELEGSPEDFSMTYLDREDVKVRDEIFALLGQHFD